MNLRYRPHHRACAVTQMSAGRLRSTRKLRSRSAVLDRSTFGRPRPSATSRTKTNGTRRPACWSRSLIAFCWISNWRSAVVIGKVRLSLLNTLSACFKAAGRRRVGLTAHETPGRRCRNPFPSRTVRTQGWRRGRWRGLPAGRRRPGAPC